MQLISSSQKQEAWQWLCREALAGNRHATAVLIDWSGTNTAPTHDCGAYEESKGKLAELAVTFQYWLDYDGRRAMPCTNGVVPPMWPSLKQVGSWSETLRNASEPFAGTEFANKLDAIDKRLREWIDYVARCHHKDGNVPGESAPVMVPLWPTRTTLESWIVALKTEPPVVP